MKQNQAPRRTDEEIVALYWSRNEEAIRQTADTLGHYCYTVAYNILGNTEDAEECVNDTYLALWNAIPPEEPDPLSAYSYRICRNTALNRYRANTALMRNTAYDLSLDELAQCIPATAMEETVSARELGRAIDTFLRKQSRDSRVIFLRRHWFGDSVKDIAAALGMKESAVSARLSRTRSALHLYLIKEGYL